MTAPAAAALINLLGYITGSVLYAIMPYLIWHMARRKLI